MGNRDRLGLLLHRQVQGVGAVPGRMLPSGQVVLQTLPGHIIRAGTLDDARRFAQRSSQGEKIVDLL